MTTIFSDGQVGSSMELNSDFSAWTGVSGSPSVQATGAHHGANAMLAEASEYAYVNFAGTDTVYFRAYVYFPTDLSAVPDFMRIVSAAGALAKVDIINDGGTLKWRLSTLKSDWAEDVVVVAAPNPTFNTAYCVELMFNANDAAGGKLYIDGNLVATQSAGTSMNSNPTGVRAGFTNWSDYDAALDCIVVADAGPIGVEGAGGISIPVVMAHRRSQGMS